MKVSNQFHELKSEQDMDFQISSGKLFGVEKRPTIETATTEAVKISGNSKKITITNNTGDFKRRISTQTPQEQQNLKIESYRQKSKNRYTGIINPSNIRLDEAENHNELYEKIMEEMPNQPPVKFLELKKDRKPSHVQISDIPLLHQDEMGKKKSSTQRQESVDEKSKKQQKIINEAKLPKSSRMQTLQQIYGVKKVQPRGANSPLKPKKRETDRELRRLKLDRAKELLEGKISTVWIYVISTQIDSDLQDRIYEVYKGLMDDENVVPYVKQAWQIEPFLQLPNTYFKIVTNIQNAEEALRFKIHIKVVEYYIYNDEGERGMSRALQYKSWSKKVKGIYVHLERIIQKTEEEIDDTIQIYRFNNGLEANIKQSKFPSFLKLSGKDKTEATLYRGNLYGALKIDANDKQTAYSHFMTLVRQKYGKIERETQNIVDYTKLKHLHLIKTLEQAEQVIKFYVRESFYYQVLNSMLRTLKSTEQFKPCILPFNQTYQSVKFYYEEYVKEHNRKIPKMELYRGARLKLRDFKSLQPGVFIEMYGFMSTSKSLDSAKKFTDKDGYLFVIHVPEREIPQKWSSYDHGFVDINKYKLASAEFMKEQQILFNALNIYKVRTVQRKGPYIYIHLEYGAVFDLLNKPRTTLIADERDVLINYQYCTKMMGDIEDQGDVHLLASEYDEAKDYYIDRISKNEANANNYYKLANVQKECGEIEEAEQNGMKCLQMMTDQLDLNDRQTCLKVFSIHSKNAEINLAKEDYLNADEELTKGIEMLDDSDIYNKAKKIRERGEIKFKKGEVKQAQKDFDLSEKMFSKIQKQGEERKWQVKKKYFLSFLTLCCSSMTREELDQERQTEMSEIEQFQKEIADMRGSIDDELVKVNKSLKDVALYAEDKDKYEYCVKKGRALLLGVQQRQTNDPAIKARLKVMEATIQDYLTLAESEKLIYDAIALIQSDTPFDPTVGEYATILAKLQKKELQRFINPETGMKLDPSKILQYNQAQNTAIYNRCKDNFQKAIKVLLYNNKTKDAPEVVNLKNQIGQLQLSTSHFKSCEQIIKEVKESASNLQHTEISKTSLLLAKISFARGELKLSFVTLQEADTLLKKIIIKSADNPKYVSIYEKNDIFLEIVLIKSKVYHKQMHHDLSLRSLAVLQEKILIKMDGYESHTLLAATYEQFAEVFASAGDRKFLDYFEKAIALRQKQMGQYNIFNAVSYCNYAKYLMLLNELQPASENLVKAVQIFSCLSNDHPINWVVHFANGVFFEQKNDFTEAEKLFKSCLNMAVKKFDSSHITIKKVRLRMAKVLLKLGSIDESFKELELLEEDVDGDLNQSRVRIEMEEETDDEKITLEKLILTELRGVIEREENKVRFSQIQLDKYKLKYDNLKASFRLEGMEKE